MPNSQLTLCRFYFFLVWQPDGRRRRSRPDPKRDRSELGNHHRPRVRKPLRARLSGVTQIDSRK